MTIGETLNRAIEEWTEKNQTTKKAFAKEADVARSTLGFFLKGDMWPGDAAIDRMAEVLGLDAEALKIMRDEEKRPLRAAEATVPQAEPQPEPLPEVEGVTPIPCPTERESTIVYLAQVLQHEREESERQIEDLTNRLVQAQTDMQGLAEELEIARLAEDEWRSNYERKCQEFDALQAELCNRPAGDADLSMNEREAVASLFGRRGTR